MKSPNRRLLLKSLLTGAVAAPVLDVRLRKDAAAIIEKASKLVTQAELQQVIEFQSAAELAAIDIRRRLETGAGLEHGKLGVSTLGLPSLDEDFWAGGKQTSYTGGPLDIEPVERIKENDFALLEKYGGDAIVLV